MERYDALVVGGGPAGSSAAWQLRRAGLRVAVIDRAVFPRDKVCAGWITPPVVSLLELDVEHYRRHGRTFQAIKGFRTGLLGGVKTETRYAVPVSFGIRRCEFDEYLLRRSGAELRCGQKATTLRRSGDEWIINDSVAAPVIVGAGGHWCPVAKELNASDRRSSIVHRPSTVAAMEFEMRLNASQLAAVQAECPLLRFYEDLSGYAWCFRKGDFLNVGVGRLDARQLHQDAERFLSALVSEGIVPPHAAGAFRGHAYLVANTSPRECIGDGCLLAGDAAGLADPHSGEGIRPAIESGLLAARTIVAAGGRYERARLESYRQQLRARFGLHAPSTRIALPPWVMPTLARGVMGSRWLTRHLVLDRWFLGRNRPELN